MSIAKRVIEKCGGVAKTAALAGTTENWVYRWTYKKDKGGTGGIVPREAQINLLAAAKAGKVSIEPSDFFEGQQ